LIEAKFEVKFPQYEVGKPVEIRNGKKRGGLLSYHCTLLYVRSSPKIDEQLKFTLKDYH
jgi:hypothetical protein